MEKIEIGLWICNVCGEMFPDDGSGLCPFCGSEDMTEVDVDESRTWQNIMVVREEAIVRIGDLVVCDNCGALFVLDDLIYCTSCGSPDFSKRREVVRQVCGSCALVFEDDGIGHCPHCGCEELTAYVKNCGGGVMAGISIWVDGFRGDGSSFPIVLRDQGSRAHRQVVFSIRGDVHGAESERVCISLEDLRAAVVAFSSYDRPITIGDPSK